MHTLVRLVAGLVVVLGAAVFGVATLTSFDAEVPARRAPIVVPDATASPVAPSTRTPGTSPGGGVTVVRPQPDDVDRDDDDAGRERDPDDDDGADDDRDDSGTGDDRIGNDRDGDDRGGDD